MRPSCLVLPVLVVLTQGCGTSAPQALGTVSLGAVIDMTGNNSEPSWADAIRLAERNANAGLKKSGLLPELRFKINFADSVNEPSIAVTRSAELVAEGAKALITDTSQVDVEIHKTFYDADPSNDLNVPIECGSCTSGTINNPAAVNANPVDQLALRNPSRWNFRSIMSTRLISQVLVNLMLKENVGADGKFKISYLGSDETFGRGAVKDVKEFAAKLFTASTPIIEEIYHPRDADPNSYDWAARAKEMTDNITNGVTDAFPDAVVIANFAQQQAAFVKAFRQGGYTTKLMHFHTFRISAALQSLGSLGDGAEGVSHVLIDGQAGQAFSDDYFERYGIPIVYRDAIYYDNATTLLLATVIASAHLPDPSQVTGAQIRDAMFKLSVPTGERIGPGADEFARAVKLIVEGKDINYAGASGPMDFDPNGNILDRLAQYRAENGLFIDVAKFDCIASDACPPM
jgi:ABC-type branched-subunit amino acid transport system substrate-binding protein